MNAVTVTLPVPPSANAYLRVWQNRLRRTNAAQLYVTACTALCRAAATAPFTGPVAVRVTWYRAQRMGDLDNRLKVLLDALQGLLYVNDSQVVRIEAIRSDAERDNPRIDLTVEEMP